MYPTFQHDLTDFGALHIARLATASLSVLTVLFTYLAAWELTRRSETGLLAGAAVAFLPEFTFRASTFSADAPVTTICALGTWMLMRLIRRGHTRRRVLGLALICGAAILAKVTGGVLLIGAVIAVVAIADVPLRTRLGRLTPLLLAPVMAFPWLLYNQVRYGDPLAQQAMHTAVRDLIDPHSLFSHYFAIEFPFTLAQSFVGLFGWTNVPLPPPLYVLYALMGCAIAAGTVSAVRRHPDQRLPIGVSLAMLMAAVVVVIDINLTFSQPQGRYLFPALPGLGVVAALAMEATPGWLRHRAALARITALGLGVLDAAILAFVEVPTYGVHW